MKRLALAGAVLGGSLLVFSGVSLGHGGVYRGPGDTVPPGGGGGGPSTPTPGGPTTPAPGGPSGPTTPAPTGPSTPGGGAAPATPAPGGPATGMPQGPNLESWTFWWGFNKERFLNLKAHLNKTEGITTPASADDILTGTSSGRDSMRPSKDQIVKDVIPALKLALEKETNRDIVTGAMVALAKIGEEPAETQKIFAKHLSSNDQEIAETAALCYGILASPEGIPTLKLLFEDLDEGRKLVGGRKEVMWRTRAFAAYGLGLIGASATDPAVQAMIQGYLLDFLEKEGSKRASQKDLRVATIIALGLIPDPNRKAVPKLEEYFATNRKREEVICAHVPTTISRLLRNGQAAERERYAMAMVNELSERSRAEAQLRPSFPQSLGVITRADDTFVKKVVEAIQEKIEKELSKNPQVAYFGMMALGEIAGTGSPGSEIEKYLVEKAKTKGGRVMTRAWAALALGVAGFDQNQRLNQPANETVGSALLDMLRDIKDPEQLAAYAVGLGLLRYTGAAAELMNCLKERVKDDTYRGYFALGLGLMNETDSKTTIQEIVKKSTRRPELIREASIALGLLGDKSIVSTLTGILADKENKTVAVQAAVATALGFVGDYRTIKPLVDMLIDEKKELSSESRAFAAVALGIVGDKEPFPWNYKVSQDLNYLATVETLNDQGSQTGILNLL